MTAAEHAYWDAQWQINVLEAGRQFVDSTPVEDMLDLLLQWPRPVTNTPRTNINVTGVCV